MNNWRWHFTHWFHWFYREWKTAKFGLNFQYKSLWVAIISKWSNIAEMCNNVTARYSKRSTFWRFDILKSLYYKPRLWCTWTSCCQIHGNHLCNYNLWFTFTLWETLSTFQVTCLCSNNWQEVLITPYTGRWHRLHRRIGGYVCSVIRWCCFLNPFSADPELTRPAAAMPQTLNTT